MGVESELGDDGLPWNPRNYRPLIINVALTGAVPSPSEFPSLPTTPAEIADAVQGCAEQGAQVFHIHMRDEVKRPTQDSDLFAETIQLIRRFTPEAIVCATTSSRAGGGYVDRLNPLRLDKKLLPDMASLSLGSFNFPKVISSNPPEEIISLAHEMAREGIVPELEVFEPGMVTHARVLQARGVLPERLVMNILLGNSGTSAATAQAIAPFLSQLPQGAEWALAGIGRFQAKASWLGIGLGGNVRIGMEDDPVGWAGEEWSNVAAVKATVEASTALNRPIASPSEARIRLGIMSK